MYRPSRRYLDDGSKMVSENSENWLIAKATVMPSPCQKSKIIYLQFYNPITQIQQTLVYNTIFKLTNDG